MDIALKPQITPFMPLPPLEFAGRERLDADIADFMCGCELLSSGRGALLRALDLVKFRGVLHIPEFFCPAVKKILTARYDVKTFLDIPSEPCARFGSIGAKQGDAVLAVNFFGLRNQQDWYSWAESVPGVVLIEDHSHAPFSDWALNTRADFSFASLRKCFPLPDGAYLRARGSAPSKIYSRGGEQPDFSRDALAAAAIDAYSPPAALPFYYSAEARLNNLNGAGRISKYSFELLKGFDIRGMENARERAYKSFVENFYPGVCEELFSKKNGEENICGNSVFSPTLKFKNMFARDRVYSALRDIGVFAVIYWGGQGAGISDPVRDEVSTIFTIPLDFRHSAVQAKALAEFISSFGF